MKIRGVLCGGPHDGHEIILEHDHLTRVIQPDGLPPGLWRWDGTKDRHGRYRLRPEATPQSVQ